METVCKFSQSSFSVRYQRIPRQGSMFCNVADPQPITLLIKDFILSSSKLFSEYPFYRIMENKSRKKTRIVILTKAKFFRASWCLKNSSRSFRDEKAKHCEKKRVLLLLENNMFTYLNIKHCVNKNKSEKTVPDLCLKCCCHCLSLLTETIIF